MPILHSSPTTNTLHFPTQSRWNSPPAPACFSIGRPGQRWEDGTKGFIQYGSRMWISACGCQNCRVGFCFTGTFARCTAAGIPWERCRQQAGYGHGMVACLNTRVSTIPHKQFEGFPWSRRWACWSGFQWGFFLNQGGRVGAHMATVSETAREFSSRAGHRACRISPLRFVRRDSFLRQTSPASCPSAEAY